MVRLKKVFSLLLALCMITALLPVMSVSTGASTAHSQAEAVEWAKARANEAWYVDVDGYYGCQCVDLILAYYDYLGVSRSHGNACDYAGNALPAGWIRVYSDPQPGDIIVWGPGAMMTPPYVTADSNYGHVGIITGIISATQVSTVETRSAYNYDPARAVECRNSNTAACFIRPDFGTKLSASWEGPTVENISETNAFPKSKITFGAKSYTSKCGIIVKDENGADVARSDENVDYKSSYVTFYYDINNELNCILESGKTYNVCFYTVTNGQEFWSPTVSFTTSHTHNYKETVVNPTCSQNGYTRHTCSCGDSYDDNYTDIVDHEYKITSETPSGIVLTCVNCGYTYTIEKTSELPSEVPSEVPTENPSDDNGLYFRKTEPDSSTEKPTENPTAPSTEKPTEPSTEPTTKPGDNTTKPTEPTTKPGDNTTKPDSRKELSLVEGCKQVLDKVKKTVSVVLEKASGTTLDDFIKMFTDGISIENDKNGLVYNGMKFKHGDDEYTVIVKGDTEADGKITAADARKILRISARLEQPDEITKSAADIDSNGKVSAAEARAVLRYAARLSTSIEAELPK